MAKTTTREVSVQERLEELRVELKSMTFILRGRRRRRDEMVAELLAVENIFLKRD